MKYTIQLPAKSIGKGLVLAHEVCHDITFPFSSHSGPSHFSPPHIPTGQTDNLRVDLIS